MIAWMAPLLVLAGMVASAQPGEALDPCAALFVPDGYDLTCEREDGADIASGARIDPTESGFGVLNRLTVARIEDDIDEPRAWLRRQVTIDVSGLQETAEDLLRSARNPLAETGLNEALLGLVEGIGALAEWPLRGCEEPVALGPEHGEAFEIRCLWGTGPAQQQLAHRLVTDEDGTRWLLTMRASSDRRMRHFQAIANEFSDPRPER